MVLGYIFVGFIFGFESWVLRWVERKKKNDSSKVFFVFNRFGFCWCLEDRRWLLTLFFWVVREAGMKLGSDTKLMQDNNWGNRDREKEENK